MNNMQQWFEQSYLDGDTIQTGQMLSSAEAFDAVQEAVRRERERILKVLEEASLPHKGANWSYHLSFKEIQAALNTPQEGLQDKQESV